MTLLSILVCVDLTPLLKFINKTDEEKPKEIITVKEVEICAPNYQKIR